MRLPFNGDYPISWDYEGHVAGGSGTPGLDWALPVGTPVVAMESGKVNYVGVDSASINPRDGSPAKFIRISGSTGQIEYVHLKDMYVNNGQNVNEGDVIGASGDSGYTTGPHLHIGLIRNGTYVNPAIYIDKRPSNSSNRESEYETVYMGEGLAAVALRAGFADYDTEYRWKELARINGSNDYVSYNRSLQPGQQIKVREVPKVQDPEFKKLYEEQLKINEKINQKLKDDQLKIDQLKQNKEELEKEISKKEKELETKKASSTIDFNLVQNKTMELSKSLSEKLGQGGKYVTPSASLATMITVFLLPWFQSNNMGTEYIVAVNGGLTTLINIVLILINHKYKIF